MLAVQTAPRPQPTLAATLASLHRAGLDQWTGPMVVFADGYAPAVDPPFRLDTTPTKLGNARTYLRIIHAAVAEIAEDRLDGLLLVEDDVVLCKNALPYVQRLAVPERTASIAIYSPIDPKLDKALLKMSSTFWSGNCAVLLTAAALAAIAASPVVAAWPRTNGADEIAAYGANTMNFLHHVPSLAQHIGDVSSMGHGRIRRSPTFRGEEFDAMSLWAPSP